MIVREVIKLIEDFAPPALAEDFDNVGLMVGDSEMRVSGVLLTLDVLEEHIDEAVDKGLNLIVSHHPLIFSPLKSVTGKNYVERVVLRAIRHGIAIYAAHTNMDKVTGGVSFRLGEKLGLKKMQVLVPAKNSFFKLVIYSPFDSSSDIRKALADSDAGHIGAYDKCSFSSAGDGRFCAMEGATPFVGHIGELHTEKEERIETIISRHKLHDTLNRVRCVHPYQEMAYDVIPLENVDYTVGLGVVGELDEAVELKEFFGQVKNLLKLPCIKYSKHGKSLIKRVALCGGAGASFVGDAMRCKADVYLTGDVRYHEFFPSEGGLTVADIGHYESEQFTLDIFYDVLSKKITNFAICKTTQNCNPINYL